MSRSLATSTSPALPSGTIVLVPVGSVEQHGPHLPLNTDTVIAEAVAERVADALCRPDVLVAPPVVYGASGEHQMFPGTTSVGTDVLCRLLVELCRSLRVWANAVLFVNGHGGNTSALVRAVRQLVEEGHCVAWVPCVTDGGDAHAGHTETSLMLHLRPQDVRHDQAEAGNTTPIARLLPRLVAEGVGVVSENGVLGDPAGASPAEGERLLEAMARRVAGLLHDGAPDEFGMLHRASPPVP